MRRWALVILIATILLSWGSGCEQDQPATFDPQRAYQDVLDQCMFGPRPTGSDELAKLREHILTTVEGAEWDTEVQTFVYQGIEGYNLIAKRGSGPILLLGAHYDTRPYADRNPEGKRDQPILGANDGGSGTAVLMELARVLDTDQIPFEIQLVFFDAEDRGQLDGWPFSVGAEEFATALETYPICAIIVDMVGDEEPTFYYEANSHPQLRELIWNVAAELGYDHVFIPQPRWSIIDDHIPFVQRNIPAVDIIDFDYPYWHTTQDTPDHVKAESLGYVGRTLEVLLEEHAEDLKRVCTGGTP